MLSFKWINKYSTTTTSNAINTKYLGNVCFDSVCCFPAQRRLQRVGRLTHVCKPPYGEGRDQQTSESITYMKVKKMLQLNENEDRIKA